MIEQLRPLTQITKSNDSLDLAELRRYLATTITTLNLILIDVDRRLNILEKLEKGDKKE